VAADAILPLKIHGSIEAVESKVYTRVMHMKDIIALFIAILFITIATMGMASADRQEHESVFVGPYELHFYANHHLEFIVDDMSSGGVGRYKITGYYVGDPDGAKFYIGIINDPTKKEISQTRKQQMDKMMGFISNAPGYVFESDDTAFLDDNHQAQIIRYTLEGTLAHEYIGIMLSGTEELFMDAPGRMETGLDDYDYAAVLENIQVIGHDITKFDGESTKPGTLSDATMWNPEKNQKKSSDASGKIGKPNKVPSGVGSGNYPQTLHECEGSDLCEWKGTWTLEGDHYNAQWENGALATIKIEKWDATGVILTRYDYAGTGAGFSGRYEGQLSGNTIRNGVLTYTYKGDTGTGKWNANW
jgi:hypothetical protein